MGEIEQRVREVIADHLAIGDEQITPEASLADDLGADSLDLIELLMDLEEELGGTIDEDRLKTLRTVQDIVEYIKEQAD